MTPSIGSGSSGNSGASGKTCLLTGGSGFFGDVLKRTLLDQGWNCVNLDPVPDPHQHPALTSYVGSILDEALLDRIGRQHRFDAVFHCAALLAHDVSDQRLLWRTNVEGTRKVAEFARKFEIPKLVYTSSNCLWGRNYGKPISETDAPEPIEIYGKSKLAGEECLKDFSNSIDIAVIRTPTIIDEGRLGLLAILFEFIAEGRRIWVVGSGRNRYQFIYAKDLAQACILALGSRSYSIYHVGSDEVKTLREVFQHVIDQAGTGSRIGSLPKWPTILAMKLSHKLGISPLGPYHFQMISEDFIFDTSKIKKELGWKPTLKNEETLWKAYRYYFEHRSEIESRKQVSSHRKGARMGVIRLLKWMS